MGVDLPALLDSIDPAQMTAVARQASGRSSLQLQGWQASQLGGGVGNPVSVGLYRFAGEGLDRAEVVPWSAVLKIIQSPANLGEVDMGEGDDPGHWNFWKRELFVYRSELFQILPEGLVAPRCFGALERPGNVAWLWLEEVRDSLAGSWTLERYALTARHLGRLNGLYVTARPLPEYSWLGNNLTRQWVGAFRTSVLALPWDHPRMRGHYPDSPTNLFRQMLVDSQRFQAGLEQLPRTLCHGDTYPTNFKSRSLGCGQEQTVALDWALLHVAPLGDDLGQFVLGAQRSLPDVRQEDVTEALFASYLDGLRDSGCRVDPQQVRFGFVTSAAFRVGLFQLFLLGDDIAHEGPVAAVPPALSDPFEVRMAREAYALLDVLQDLVG
jgi:hypothetical protein